jgi:hypothetical protein
MQPTLETGLRTAPAAAHVAVFDDARGEFMSVEDAWLAQKISGQFGALTPSSGSDAWIVQGLNDEEETETTKGGEIVLSTDLNTANGSHLEAARSSTGADTGASTSSLVDWKAKFAGLGSGVKAGLKA